MKLNYKRTILCGFAFFLITAFWQAYDATIPVILTNKFGLSQFWSGVVMALDNVLSLFLLPFFGSISDKTKGKWGKRTPYIAVGTILAALLITGISFVDNAQLKNISDVSTLDDPAALSIVYDSEKDIVLKTPSGEKYKLSELYSNKEEFVSIKCETEKDGKTVTNPDYTDYVAPARHSYVGRKTAENNTELIIFIVLLLALLLSMSIFRSPAVALMPDITLKPLRSKANAIINLMGTAGGILILVLGIIFGTGSIKNSFMSYTAYYGVVAGIMVVALVIFLATVKEKRWSKEMEEDSIKYGIEESGDGEKVIEHKLTRGEMASLIFILISVALWYFGYNAITSKYSVYATNILNMDYNTTMLIAQGAAIIAYIPAGIVATKLGRKKTIIGGVILLGTAFGAASFMNASSSVLVMNILFAMAGIGWATINVNSFPMVVEMASGGNVGKFTGYYYTASMAAQIVTPLLSGFLMDKIAETVLFPYATAFVILALLMMLCVRHGEAKKVEAGK